MKKLLLFLLFSSLICFGQEDIERFKVYDTTNNYISLLLDTATGQTWQLQIGIGDNSSRMKTVLSDTKQAETLEDITETVDSNFKYWQETYNSKPDSIVSVEDKAYWKPYTLDEKLSRSAISQNGRFKLYPTDNMYNFIMVDVINGNTYQVQWNIDRDKRFVMRFW